jgi:ABC-type transport system involved in multi-copper enzyme maturation permease subunit
MMLAVVTVMKYELRRACTWLRFLIGLLLIAFPVVLLGVARFIEGAFPTDIAIVASYILIPQIVCALTLLLTAAPLIQTEIESQNWIYLALRPSGKQALVLGKYLVAVSMATLSGVLCAILASAVAVDVALAPKLAGTLSVLVVLSSLAYGAMYVLIGVLAQRRAMVIAVAYSLVVEVVVSLIPATINQFTISYRLRGLLAKWMDVQFGPQVELFLGSESPQEHVFKLLLLTACLLAVALTAVRLRELPMHGDI